MRRPLLAAALVLATRVHAGEPAADARRAEDAAARAEAAATRTEAAATRVESAMERLDKIIEALAAEHEHQRGGGTSKKK